MSPDAINTGALFLGGSNAMGVVGTNAQFAPGGLFTKTSFFSGGVERMTIDGTTGNVGIGTTVPAAKLDVNGNLNLPNTTSATVGVLTLGGAPFLHNFPGTADSNSTFVGASAGNMTMTGAANSAFGALALNNNTTGFENAAFGSGALFASTSGNDNTAVGRNSLDDLFSGDFNVAIGADAGVGLRNGSGNIYIGSSGPPEPGGFAVNESNVIRIGNVNTSGAFPPFQTAAFIAGISGATSASGIAVLVNSSGQLGTTTSSRRFKHAIADMGAESDLLMKLRPVAFYYRPELDETQTRQYGLVAEEVAQVAPDLVVFDKDGQPQTVHAMLLNEVQKQRRTIQRQQAEIEELTARLAKLESLITPKQ